MQKLVQQQLYGEENMLLRQIVWDVPVAKEKQGKEMTGVGMQ
jgi:hypothetical protein